MKLTSPQNLNFFGRSHFGPLHLVSVLLGHNVSTRQNCVKKYKKMFTILYGVNIPHSHFSLIFITDTAWFRSLCHYVCVRSLYEWEGRGLWQESPISFQEISYCYRLANISILCPSFCVEETGRYVNEDLGSHLSRCVASRVAPPATRALHSGSV